MKIFVEFGLDVLRKHQLSEQATQEELEEFFVPEIEALSQRMKCTTEECRAEFLSRLLM